ncbi:unnamed protein product [Ceutorhynchus assimilis]|uniref:Rho GTPase-activating protein 17 n=1 Tax=Ceutorhynchus assimilis TaxID=467358 RepID=A0A9N9MX03_9CUCU|nr:unnamed protein product [Ceutorhynchus assimilis]
MKKQFFRVKQLADQTFLKAEKSEVLNHEELQLADQRVDVLRSALVAVNKKICPNGPISDKEKRLKKCLEYQIGSSFVEEARDEKDCILLQHVLKISGNAEQDLAKEYAEHEAKVEEMVYGPLQKVIENELPSILKQKHNLKKYCLDKDSASNRYQATKKETLKEDMEEAESKVEQSRDALAIEMYNLLGRENELSSYILQLLKLQRGYHESALKNLENIIPQLEKTIGDSPVKRVFGVSLQEHLRVNGRRLAYPLEICVTALQEHSMSEEGLFRIAGGLSKVKRLKAAIDSGCFAYLIPEYNDHHVLASTLKSYLRELPEPLLTYHLHKEWVHSMQYPDNQKVEVVKHLLNKLPQENKDNLAYLIQFLARLTGHTENKMSSSNIAIVMAPNLLWNKNEEMNVNMGNCVTINMLVELLIKEVNQFFPDEITGLLTIADLYQDEELLRHNGKFPLDHTDATSTENLVDSPRPNLRKKKPAAPVPPNATNHRNEFDHMTDKLSNSYPSGSSTLNRPPKPKEPPAKMRTSTGVNTEENDLSLSRKRSFSKDDIKLVNIAASISQNVVQSTVVAQPLVSNDVSKVGSKSPHTVLEEPERNFKTTVTHHVGSSANEESNSIPKPVAAPRPSLLSDERTPSGNISRNPSIRSMSGSDIMSKSNNSAEFGDVQLRRKEMLNKPEVPARPSTLMSVKRSSMDIDPTLQKTQCSVYSVANKQQPSIVNIQNRTEKIQLGHDVMMAEKEKFLGHFPAPRASLENKFNDINSNRDRSRPTSTSGDMKPTIPPKSPSLSKSNEKLDIARSNDQLEMLKPQDDNLFDKIMTSKSSEKLNELNENRFLNKASHTRTRSDGNIMELGLLHTPPSPRSLNKPTEPPPPPPVIKKPAPESTDF